MGRELFNHRCQQLQPRAPRRCGPQLAGLRVDARQLRPAFLRGRVQPAALDDGGCRGMHLRGGRVNGKTRTCRRSKACCGQASQKEPLCRCSSPPALQVRPCPASAHAAHPARERSLPPRTPPASSAGAEGRLLAARARCAAGIGGWPAGPGAPPPPTGPEPLHAAPAQPAAGDPRARRLGGGMLGLQQQRTAVHSPSQWAAFSISRQAPPGL